MDNNKKQYKVTQDENDYILTSELYQNNIRLTLQEINKNNPLIYVGDFSVQDLKKINEIFYTTSTKEEALSVINNIIEEQKVNIEKKQNYINIILFLNEENQNEDNYFTLKCNISNLQNLQRSYSSNVIYSSTKTPVEITYSPPTRLPVMHVKLPTIHTRLPTIHTNVIEDDSNQNDINTPSTSQITSYFTPQRDNIIHKQIMTPVQNNEIKSQFTSISTQNYNYKSPKREQIQYIIPGSPSTGMYNYSAVSSKYRNISSQNNIIQTTMQDNSFAQNPNEYSNSMNSSEDKIEITKLQKETDKIKYDHEFLKKKTYELINEVKLLRNQIQILNNENQNLRNNKGISPSESQIHEIVFLKNEVKRLSDELSNKKMKENSVFERYKQIKEEEINLYKLQIEQLKLLNIQKEKEIKDLKFQLSNYSKIEKAQYIQDSCLEIVKGEIIHNNNELEFLTKNICDNKKKMTLNLLYKATVDSDKASAFHNKCDGAKSTIVLVESRNGKRFGGFTSCDWKGNAIEKKDENAFVFSLDKMKAYNIIPGELAIGCYPKFGPVFLGCQIRIYDEAFIKGGTTFEKEKNYETKEDYELTGGLKKFEVKEIEVYSVELD